MLPTPTGSRVGALHPHGLKLHALLGSASELSSNFQGGHGSTRKVNHHQGRGTCETESSTEYRHRLPSPEVSRWLLGLVNWHERGTERERGSMAFSGSTRNLSPRKSCHTRAHTTQAWTWPPSPTEWANPHCPVVCKKTAGSSGKSVRRQQIWV